MFVRQPGEHYLVTSGTTLPGCESGMSSLRLLPALLVAIAQPLSAQVANRLTNPDFAMDLAGWTTSTQNGASLYRDSCFGSPASGAMVLSANGTGRLAHAEQCIDVSTLTGIEVMLRKLKSTENGTGGHRFRLQVFDGAACAGNVLLDMDLPETGSTYPDACTSIAWTGIDSGPMALPANATSALLSLETSGGAMSGNSTYIFDHIELGEPDTLFRDGFEGP